MPPIRPLDPLSALPAGQIIGLAVALSLGVAIALGVTRFAYGLLLPSMKTDLGWSYTLAGAMNTANALGYLIGAVLTPSLLRRLEPGNVLVGGALLATAFMAASGFFVEAAALLLQRLLAGIASAFVFVAGGVLAARLGGLQPSRAGLLLGIYYGGAGLGIALSALLVPSAMMVGAARPHSWQLAWWLLALLCAAATAGMLWPARVLRTIDESGGRATTGRRDESVWRSFRWALAGYAMFGLGYIGYMTFVVALLHEHGTSAAQITVFYALLGLAVMVSSRIWATLLDRFTGGFALAILNAVTGLAAVLPAFTQFWPLTVLSGIGFGAAFMSVPAATTAIVRHNLPSSLYPAGISAFTLVFAAGQIVGPTVVGWVADGPGGVARGLVLSAAALWLGAVVALRQRPLRQPGD